MLLGARPHDKIEAESTSGFVHNYYERLVFDRINEILSEEQKEGNFIADVACVALNHLPPRYVRHDVDMTFFLSSVELEETLEKINTAVKKAALYVEKCNSRSNS